MFFQGKTVGINTQEISPGSPEMPSLPVAWLVLLPF